VTEREDRALKKAAEGRQEAPRNVAEGEFGARLAEAVARKGQLCAGIDPHPALIEQWGFSLDSAGLERFALTATEAIAPWVAIVKPQAAFFEAFGAAGLAVLARVQECARECGALVLLDAKRGDIGSTMDAYARAYLTESGPLAADALTVSPYLGFGSLSPALSAARASGRGVFVLARTSNPDSSEIQNARLATGKTVAQSIVDDVARVNRDAEAMGSVGVVVGATVPPGEVDLSDVKGPILAPGFGAQGATVEDLRRLFGQQMSSVLAASSREILLAGPNSVALSDAVRRVQESLAAAH
jgi:orotidine-5'-phosphate decarboxylase